MEARNPAKLMVYTYVLADPARVHQTITLYDDGQVWYWATQPGARESGGAGTYVFVVDPVTLSLARSIAETLIELPISPASPVFNVIAVAVTTYAGGRERTHQLGFTAAKDLPLPLSQARDLGETLAAQAETAPLAVAQLACMPGAAVLHASDRATLRFTFTNAGTQSVTFLLDQQSFSVQALSGGEWQTCWQHGGSDHLGLVGPKGEFVDGLILPATIAPGATATAVFLQVLRRQVLGPVSLRGQVEGTIALLHRDEAPPDFPHEPFRLISAPQTLTIE